jgi:hypothetical protein
MTRVDDNREAQRAEEERAAKEAQKAKRSQNDDLKRQMNKQQQVAQDNHKKTQEKQNQGRAAGQALLARQGIASRNLSQALQARGDQDVQKGATEHKRARQEVLDKADESSERNAKLDKQEQLQNDKLAPISRDDQKGSGGQGGGDAGGSPSGGHQVQGQPQVAQVEMASGPKEAQAARGPQMPPEAFRELVKQMFAGVTPTGDHLVTVELTGFFDGVRVDVQSKNGNVSCTFHTPAGRKDLRDLLKASEGPLARALDQRKMRLSRLAVE